MDKQWIKNVVVIIICLYSLRFIINCNEDIARMNRYKQFDIGFHYPIMTVSKYRQL